MKISTTAICLLSLLNFFLANVTEAGLFSSQLDLSGNLSLTNKSDYTQIIEPNSEFSGSHESYLNFHVVGATTGRSYDSLMQLNTINEITSLQIASSISQIDSAVHTYDPGTYTYGFKHMAYAYLTFYSDTNESITFTHTHSGSLGDHSHLYHPFGESYNIWSNPFPDEIIFEHQAGQYYDYTFQFAFNLGGGNQAYDLDSNLNWQITPSAVPIPGTVLLLGTGLIGLVGYRKKFKK